MGEGRKALWVSPEAQRQFDAMKATGPQRSDSGAPNPEPVGLVTVELTREEAEHAMARGEHPSNAPMVNGYFCPDCMRIAAKLRASLERTGK